MDTSSDKARILPMASPGHGYGGAICIPIYNNTK